MNWPVLRLTNLEKTRILEQSNVQGRMHMILQQPRETASLSRIILILAIVIVLIIREKRAENLIMIWITAEDVIAIHSKIVQIVGGIDGIRDCAGLEAAIADRSVKEAGLLDWITFVTNHKATQIKCDLRCLIKCKFLPKVI